MEKGIFAFLLAGCLVSLSADPLPDWRIEAGPVRIDPRDPTMVGGTFVVRAPPGTAPQVAGRQGGACLVADLLARGIGMASCQTDLDCNTQEAIDKEDHPHLQTYYGYCLSRDGSLERPRCWTRPGPPQTHCSRTVDGLQLTEGVHELASVMADPLGLGAPYPEWAVLACMADEGHERACGQASDAHRQRSVSPENND